VTHLFQEAPRKVHMFHDQQGATYNGGRGARKLYVDTLCKGNWDRRSTLTTTVSSEVTCKICLQRMMEPQYKRVPKLALPTPALKSNHRYRQNWRGKLILQVEVAYSTMDGRDPLDFGETTYRWRDATLADLNNGVV